jgi:hypothetical protein
MQVNINATGMNAVPFQVGVSEEADIERLFILVFLNGASYSCNRSPDLSALLPACHVSIMPSWLK